MTRICADMHVAESSGLISAQLPPSLRFRSQFISLDSKSSHIILDSVKFRLSRRNVTCNSASQWLWHLFVYLLSQGTAIKFVAPIFALNLYRSTCVTTSSSK